MSASLSPALSRPPHLAAMAGAGILAIGMGFGRFAFTGMYPQMLRDNLLSLHTGTWAASANYAGYLLGAMLVTRVRPASGKNMVIWSTLGTLLCLAALGLVANTWGIIAIRALAGVFSAVAMIGASLWLLQYLGHPGGAPVLFAGVGCGIILSSELMALGQAYGLSSMRIWLVLALAGVIVTFACRSIIHHSGPPDASTHGSRPASRAVVQPLAPTAFNAWMLVAIYGLEGLGYVITATYLPVLLAHALPNVSTTQIWAAFGLGAAPSCFLWHAVQTRWGARKALIISLFAQAIGVVLPVISPTPPAYLLSALLVGGTFLGLVMIVISCARALAHTMSLNMVATATVSLSVGQIIGPLVTSFFFALTHTLNTALLIATGALLLGTVMSRCLRLHKETAGAASPCSPA